VNGGYITDFICKITDSERMTEGVPARAQVVNPQSVVLCNLSKHSKLGIHRS
jgi:hypothetical protein